VSVTPENLRRLFGLLILATLLPPGRAEAPAPGTTPLKVRMLVESTSPPFCFRDEQGRPTGFAVELINAIGKDQGLVVEADLRPWQEIYPEFIQHAATAANIARAGLGLLRDESRRREVKVALARIIQSLGGPGAADRAADVILSLLP